MSKFPGFPPEPRTNFWPYPRVMNGWWHVLSGSEQKVLDYLLRRTWGWDKMEDFISYSQFLKGIRKKTGEWLDKGCGIKSSKTLAKALKGLVSKGFVEVVKFTGRPNFYRLKLVADEGESKEPLYKVKNTSLLCKEVTSVESEETIDSFTINSVQKIAEKFSAPCPEDLLEAWNKICSNLPRVLGLSRKRVKNCVARLKERPLSEWEKIFRKMNDTPFLCGENERGWRATFDWIIVNQDNALKILEGKYQSVKQVPNLRKILSEEDV